MEPRLKVKVKALALQILQS